MIIVPITGPSAEEAATQIATSVQYADLFEIRVDLLPRTDIENLISLARRPAIATCRPLREGGLFEGSEESRFALLQRAIDAGAKFVDLELDAWKKGRQALKPRKHRLTWIVSHHELREYPRRVATVYRALRKTGADIVKFAYKADDAWQIKAAMQFAALARADRQRAIAIGMGEAGEASRVLYKILGGWATFAGSEDGRQSAPGQLPASIMKKVFRSDKRTPRTKVFALVGNPVSQSKGIYIHNPLYRRMGKDAIYCRFRVDDLPRFMNAVDGLLTGCSVTTPHKEGMVRFLKTMDPLARTLGAVNTVVRRGGGYFGANTDARGALDAIEQKLKVGGKRVVIVGAGGAARAIAGEAARRGAEVFVANRTIARAESVAQALGVNCATLEEIPSLQPSILVNATSVGMWPATDASPVAEIPSSVRLAFDVIYNPSVTKFLNDALAAGATIVTGVEMYTRQAVEQIRILTGRKPGGSAVKRLFLAAAHSTLPQAPEPVTRTLDPKP